MENKNTISVLLIEPGKYPKIIDMEDSLEAMQKAVGGYIELLHLDDEVSIICNEEGKICGLPLNRAIYADQDKKEMIEIIAGTFFVAYTPPDSGEIESLPKELSDKYKELFKYPEQFFRTAEGIKAVPYIPAKTAEIVR